MKCHKTVTVSIIIFKFNKTSIKLEEQIVLLYISHYELMLIIFKIFIKYFDFPYLLKHQFIHGNVLFLSSI